jgi:alpha-tubulin suppressor-like RCC1 family protein
MNPRSIHRAALLPVVAAALLSACSDRLPLDPSASPVSPRLTVTATNPFVTIDVGLTHSCGLTSGGQSWCWGRNAGGQLGDSTASSTLVPVATFQTGGPTFCSVITAGNSHSCSIDTSNAPWCWGYNGDGRIGDGTFVLRMAPSAVTGGLSLTTISAGGQHTCALDGSGQAYCWGSNAYGQIGDSTTAFAYGPTAVHQPVGVTFTQISAADKHTCALASSGAAYCWGYGGDGAIGHNSLIGPKVPTAVSQPVGVTFTAVVTEYNHSCGLTSGGQAYCWGLNSSSQLGDSTTTNRTTPVAVQQPGGLTFAALTTGSSDTCGLDGSGQAYCWGNNSNGQLGNGTTTATRVPTAVSQPGGVTFTQIGAGSVHTCALDTGGQAWCWGRNQYGQIGDGTSTQRTTPTAVSH